MPSLEWRVESADLIVRGTVTGGWDVVVNGVTWREVTMDVRETIKGERGETVLFRMRPRGTLAKGEEVGSDVLVFLGPADVRNGGAAQWEVKDGWMFTLGAGLPTLWRMDGSQVKDQEAFLKSMREAVAFAIKRGGKCEPYNWLRSVGLIVPKDARLEALGRRWVESENASLRMDAAMVLAQFPTAQNDALLRKLLKDPYYVVTEAKEWSPAVAWRGMKEYPVRQVAARYVSLRPQDHEIEAYMKYSPVGWGWWATGVALLVAVALFRRGKLKRLGVGGRVALLSAGLAVLAGVSWCGTQWEGRSYSLAVGGADYEMVSNGGRVAILRVVDHAPRHGLVVRRLEASLSTSGLWFASMLSPGETAGVKGVSFSGGKTTDSAGYSYRLVEMHYLWVVGLLVGWPIVWRVGRGRSAVRAKRWARENRCAGCGYDLRGHAEEVGCPECGRGR